MRKLILPVTKFGKCTVTVLVSVFTKLLSKTTFLGRIKHFCDRRGRDVGINCFVVTVSPRVVFNGACRRGVVNCIGRLEDDGPISKVAIVLPKSSQLGFGGGLWTSLYLQVKSFG